MTEPAPGPPEPVTETWTYGGIRADKDGKKWHAWADQAGETPQELKCQAATED